MSEEIAIKAELLPIYKLEKEMQKCPQLEIPTYHDFCKGLYARSIVMPAGSLVTGAVHKYECFFVVRSGCVIITTDEGPTKAESGYMTVTKSGGKRALLALVDTLITTFHANPEELREPDEVWDHFTVTAPENIIEVLERMKLEE